MKYRKVNVQLDFEIQQYLAEHGPQTQYRIIRTLKAPPTTIRRHLKKGVILGTLDSIDGPRGSIIYSLPSRHGNPPPGPKLYIRGKPRARKVER